jgi:hypothetical protein
VTVSASELSGKPRSEFDKDSGLPELLNRSAWVYRRSNLTLTHRESDYEVDLERIKSSGDMMDWIAQLNEKAWVTPQALGEFARLLIEIFGERPARGGTDTAHDVKKGIAGRPLLQQDYS